VFVDINAAGAGVLAHLDDVATSRPSVVGGRGDHVIEATGDGLVLWS